MYMYPNTATEEPKIKNRVVRFGAVRAKEWSEDRVRVCGVCRKHIVRSRSTMMMRFAVLLFVAVVAFSSAFTTPSSPLQRISVSLEAELSRRDAAAFGLATATGLLTNSRMAFAASGAPTADDLSRIKQGYEGLEYLLANFEQETTVCRENGGECKRDADPVRKYLGLRSTQDPLFQIDKVFNKVKNMDLDPDKLDDFFEAAEEWNSAMNMSNSMAFISQFGEYNPGGGKDEVLKYLNEAQKQVVSAKNSLKTIMDVLEIS